MATGTQHIWAFEHINTLLRQKEKLYTKEENKPEVRNMNRLFT